MPPRCKQAALDIARLVALTAAYNTIGGWLNHPPIVLLNLLVDERDARASRDVSIIDAAPTAIIPEEIHLADEYPAIGENLLHMGDVSRAQRSFHTWLEDDRGVGIGRIRHNIAPRARAIGPGPGIADAPEVFVGPFVGCPPGALPE